MGRWQSGQLHQTVNLTPHGYVGSNPTLPKLLLLYTQDRVRSPMQHVYVCFAIQKHIVRLEAMLL